MLANERGRKNYLVLIAAIAAFDMALGRIDTRPRAWRELANDWGGTLENMRADLRIMVNDRCCSECGLPEENCVCMKGVKNERAEDRQPGAA